MNEGLENKQSFSELKVTVEQLLQKELEIPQEIEVLTKLFSYAGTTTDIECLKTCLDLYIRILEKATYPHITKNTFSSKVATAGYNAYQLQEYEVATHFFKLAVDGDDSNAKNNLAYMIRRDETIGYEFSIVDALKLLRPGVEGKQAFSLVNTALIFALNFGDDSSWLIADRIFATLKNQNTSSVEEWWRSLSGAEGSLVHLFLIRHGKIASSSLGSVTELYKVIKDTYKNVPSWIKDIKE